MRFWDSITSTIKSRSTSRIVLIQTELLTPRQMTAAFAVADTQLQWRATLQAIEEEIRETYSAAQQLTLNPPACAAEVAGAEHLERLRMKLWALRDEGIKTLATE